ncbi:MAG: leucine-rich repeat protein [Christensenellaceae bacterium]|jgi:hypothetical protein|nr:leucine-rich repeat protein [Christensenellaceae bacterium]
MDFNPFDGISKKHLTQKKTVFIIILISILIALLMLLASCKSLEVVSIELEGTFITAYYIGDSMPTGKIKITYEDSSNEVIEITESMISGYDSSTLGEKLLTISYGGEEIKIKITIRDKANTITVKENSIKTYYGIGEPFNDENAIIIVNWADAGNKEIAITPKMLTNWDTSRIGIRDVEVSYEGATTSFEIIVSGNIYRESSLVIQEDHVFYVGDSFSGIFMRLTAFDETIIDCALKSSDVTGFNTDDVGEKTLTVEYKCEHDEYADPVTYRSQITITVVENTLNGIEILAGTFKTEYLVGDDFESSTLKLKYAKEDTYIDITTEMLIGFNTSEAAKLNVKIEYLDYEISTVVNVRKVTSIELRSFKYAYELNEAFPMFGVINATFTNTVDVIKKNLAFHIGMVDGFYTATKGYREVTINYMGATTSAYIFVDLTIKSVSLLQNTYKYAYEKGSEFCPTESLRLEFEDDGFEPLTVLMSNYMLRDYQFNSIGIDTSRTGRNTYWIDYFTQDIYITIAVSGTEEFGDYDLLYFDTKYDIYVPEEITPEDLQLSQNDHQRGYAIIGYNGNSDEVVIPNSYYTVDISVIAPGILSGHTEIKNLTVPFIGFSDEHQYNLDYFFSDSDDESAVDAVRATLKSVTIQTGYITEVPFGAFAGYFNLTSINLPDNITEIGAYAFTDCSAIPSITIPSSVEKIGLYAFAGTPAVIILTSPQMLYVDEFEVIFDDYILDTPVISLIVVSDELYNDYIQDDYWKEYANYIARKSAVEYVNNYFIVRDKKTLVRYTGSDSTISVPSSITKIASYAFFCNAEMVKVNLPSGLTEIGAFAFSGVTEIYELYLGVNLSPGRSKLKTITLPSKLKSIGVGAFYKCVSLTYIEIPALVESIGAKAFFIDNDLTIYFRGAQIEIGDEVFSALVVIIVPDDHYENYMTEPTWIDYVDYIVRASSRSDTGFIIEDNVLISYLGSEDSIIIPDNITKIGARAFRNNPFILNVTLNANLTTIEEYAFSGCIGLSSVEIPVESKLTYIGKGAFENATQLHSFDIPTGVAILSESVFAGSGLYSIDIHSGIEIIGDFAFANCEILNSVDFMSGKLSSIGKSAFAGCQSLYQIDMPITVETIGARAFENSGLVNISIPSNSILEEIGEYAFSGCLGLENIVMPDSLTTIMSHAFYNCSNLRSVEFSENSELLLILDYAFANNFDLESFDIPEGVFTIGEGVFYGSALTSITIHSNVFIIQSKAFENCYNLASVTFEDDSALTSIGEKAFAGCSSLTSIKIPRLVEMLESYAFEKAGLESIDFEDNSKLEDIQEGVFSYCVNLTSIALPASLITIAKHAFESCIKLYSVAIGEAIEAISTEAFLDCVMLSEQNYSISIDKVNGDETLLLEENWNYIRKDGDSQVYANVSWRQES